MDQFDIDELLSDFYDDFFDKPPELTVYYNDQSYHAKIINSTLFFDSMAIRLSAEQVLWASQPGVVAAISTDLNFIPLRRFNIRGNIVHALAFDDLSIYWKSSLQMLYNPLKYN
ncbi:MAG: hypothetical protein INQ03_08910 [Candidatus Heimdallarchaeota archaeon]|nr:hypothetical protein [Candidatus Heimdallarchaeota archaeon]